MLLISRRSSRTPVTRAQLTMFDLHQNGRRSRESGIPHGPGCTSVPYCPSLSLSFSLPHSPSSWKHLLQLPPLHFFPQTSEAMKYNYLILLKRFFRALYFYYLHFKMFSFYFFCKHCGSFSCDLIIFYFFCFCLLNIKTNFIRLQ